MGFSINKSLSWKVSSQNAIATWLIGFSLPLDLSHTVDFEWQAGAPLAFEEAVLGVSMHAREDVCQECTAIAWCMSLFSLLIYAFRRIMN